MIIKKEIAKYTLTGIALAVVVFLIGYGTYELMEYLMKQHLLSVLH